MLAKATIRDVARLARVSPAAVSRWLNGSIQLPAKTGDRIRAAVAELKYQPHAQARRLSRGRAEAIGIIVPDIANPFFALLAGEAERIAVAAGYDVVIWSSRNQLARELACFDRLSSGYIDGLLLITNHADDGQLAERVAGAPGRVVIVDEDVPETAVPKFFVENERGGYLATRHLIENGHQRIAHMGGPRGVMSAIERASGWRRALSEAGIIVPDAWHIASEYEVDQARADAVALFALTPAPTAVFAGSDAIALGIMYRAREHGIVIPDDLSLVGFDGMPITELLQPALTTIGQPIDSLGRLGAEQLIAMVNGVGSSSAETARLPVSLVVRGSVAAPQGAKLLRSS